MSIPANYLDLFIFVSIQKNYMQNDQHTTSLLIISENEAINKALRKKSSPSQAKKSSTKAVTLDGQLFASFFRLLHREQTHNELGITQNVRNFIKESIVPLNNKHVPAFSNMLRESLIHDQLERFEKEQNKESFEKSLELYARMNAIYRQCGVNSPILIATYQQFEGLWMKQIKLMGTISMMIKERMILLWKQVPFQCLKIFLSSFHLNDIFQQLDTDTFLKHLGNDLFEGKIQQVVQYYTLYTFQRKNKEEDILLLHKFEDEQLVPRLTKKDQLFTEHVLNFIKHHHEIASKLYASIDVQQEEKLMALTGEDSSKHQRVAHRAMRRHYRDIVTKCKKWYIIQDKLSYSRTFTQWYAKHLQGNNEQDNSESDGEVSKTSASQFSSKQQAINISKSIIARLDRLLQEQIIKNPLYEYDAFRPAQLLMQQTELTTTTWKNEDYISLQQEKVIFISQIDQNFQSAKNDLFASKVIGFDSQFMPTQSKFVQGGVSIIQLASPSKVYIFDYQHLRNYPPFIDFFIQLMENQKIIKVGHTFSSDLQYLGKNFPKKFNSKALIDIAKLFKQLYPHELYTSLAYLTQKFTGKQLCKFEQRSNWARRPLKKTQLYYAALDADVCLEIYRHLQSNQSEAQPIMLLHSKSQTEQEKHAHEFNFIKYAELLKEPKFLVDNMLKKLSSTLRNCGIDAQFISIRDHQLAQSQAKRQKRIIITRDSKLSQRKGQTSPVYLLRQRSDTQLMFQQLLTVFNIDLSHYKTLSRCVKCNCPDLLIITCEEAQTEIKFLYENNIREYWRCVKCRQIYWEGGQFAKAKHKYDALRTKE